MAFLSIEIYRSAGETILCIGEYYTAILKTSLISIFILPYVFTLIAGNIAINTAKQRLVQKPIEVAI
jgi:hypothetical protein